MKNVKSIIGVILILVAIWMLFMMNAGAAMKYVGGIVALVIGVALIVKGKKCCDKTPDKPVAPEPPQAPQG